MKKAFKEGDKLLSAGGHELRIKAAVRDVEDSCTVLTLENPRSGGTVTLIVTDEVIKIGGK